MPTILIVEDNDMNRDMLARRLRRRGYDVLVAVDGAEGLAMAREAHPDIILMDLGLPVVDGWEATRRLKQNEETNTIPVVALTAHAMAGDEARAREAGCDAFDTKPVDIERLVGTIESFVTRNPVA
jgi:CheY-like chemotaxis protein